MTLEKEFHPYAVAAQERRQQEAEAAKILSEQWRRRLTVFAGQYPSPKKEGSVNAVAFSGIIVGRGRREKGGELFPFACLLVRITEIKKKGKPRIDYCVLTGEKGHFPATFNTRTGAVRVRWDKKTIEYPNIAADEVIPENAPINRAVRLTKGGEHLFFLSESSTLTSDFVMVLIPPAEIPPQSNPKDSLAPSKWKAFENNTRGQIGRHILPSRLAKLWTNASLIG